MKRALYVSVFLLCLNSVFAQLYVKDAYIYNKGSVVYAKGNLELNNANSNFYLRNEGQFVQGTTGASTNRGLGKLSVFQEGTVNNFAYNYWCSPVGNASPSSGNEDFGITMLNVPTSVTASNPITVTGGLNGTSAPSALTVSSYWIFRFLALPDYSGWSHSYAASNIAAGQGFTMKGVSGDDTTAGIGESTFNNPAGSGGINDYQRYDFRGKPNDGNISVIVAPNNFTLTGNPYPSALHVNAFLLDPANTDCTGVAYYWEQDKSVNSHAILAYRGGYGTFAPGGTGPTDYGVYVPAFFNSYNLDGTVNTTGSSSGLSIQRKYAPIGQGFMIKGKATGSPTSVTLKNSHREYYKEAGAYSEFERNANGAANRDNVGINTTSHLRLNTIINNLNTRQLALTFIPHATDGVDRGIDALSPDPDLTNDVYFFLENERYVIEGIQFDVAKRVPLGVSVNNNTSFKFNLMQAVDFDENQPVYLYDALDGSYHNLRQNDYEVTLATGIYNNRFEITFRDGNALGVNHPIKENITIVQNNATQMLTVSNPNLIEVKSISLFDIGGKLLFNKTKLGSRANYEFSMASFSDAVYLVKVESVDGQSVGQKIIVSSKK